MGRVTITLPRLGETMEEARVTDWLVAPGAAFKRGDVLLEVETDKTVVEVPALMDGTLGAQLVAPGDMVALDQPIAEVEVIGASDPPQPQQPTSPAMPRPAASGGHPDVGGYPAAPPPVAATIPGTTAQPRGHLRQDHPKTGPAQPRPAASPAARAAARRAGLDLALIAGSGRRGRITAADVASRRPAGPSPRAPIVLLHGLFDSPRGWRDLPRRLSRLGHPVLTPDLPGHGESAETAESFDQAVQITERTLPRGPLHLIGHSLGAAIAARIATLRGADILSLTLLAPAGLGMGINSDFIPAMLGARDTSTLAKALALLDGGPISDMALQQELARLAASRPRLTALAHSLGVDGRQKIDITSDLARLTCPLRVIFGTRDRILDWQDVAHLPARAAIHLVAGAGHLPHVAAPDLIADFLTQEDRPQRISA